MKKFRLLITHILLAVMLVGIMSVSTFAAEETYELEIQLDIGYKYMYVNDEKIYLPSSARPYINDGGYPMYPVLNIAEAFVLPNNIMETDDSVMIIYGKRLITIDKKNNGTVMVNGSTIPLDTPLVYKDDVLFLTLYDIAAIFGAADAYWEESSWFAWLTIESYIYWHKHDWASKESFNDTHHWRECEASNCFITEIEEMPLYGEHDFRATSITEPTEDSSGIATYSCWQCGKSYTEEYTGTPPSDNEEEILIDIPIGEIFMVVNNEETELSAPAYINDDGYTMVPLMDIAKTFIHPNNIIFDEWTDYYTILYGQRIITIGKEEGDVHMNGSDIPLQTPLFWDEDNNIFLSLRDTTLLLDANGFLWDSATQTITFSFGEHTHIWTNALEYDDTHHWKGCKKTACDRIDESSYTAHTFQAEGIITPPTCTEQGYTSYSCSCGYTCKDDYTNPAGHSFVNGICISCKKKGGEYRAATWVSDPANAEVAITAKESICAITASYQNGKMAALDMICLDAGDSDTLTLHTIGDTAKLFILSPDHIPFMQPVLL